MAEPLNRDGRAWIGVLPCSRVTSRAVGPLAWVVLEELALRAQVGEKLAIETNVRALSSDLGIGKDTVAQALSRLVDLGLVSSQAQRRAGRTAPSSGTMWRRTAQVYWSKVATSTRPSLAGSHTRL